MDVAAYRNGPIYMSVGGNALTLGKDRVTVPDQFEAAAQSAAIVARVYQWAKRVALTHGNGPQAGFIDRRNAFALANQILHPVPLDSVVADTQGAMGYMFERVLRDELPDSPIVSLNTQVLINPNHSASKLYTKPIGDWMTEVAAAVRREEYGWHVAYFPDEGEEGKLWRRVVPSPVPQKILGKREIEHLVNARFLTICGGGGGVPVYYGPEGELKGFEGVIDKDLTTALIAQNHAHLMAILTEAPGVMTKEEFAAHGNQGRVISELNVRDALNLSFTLPSGSMGRKLEACARFTGLTGKPSLITNFEHALPAILNGDGGTWIVAR